MRLAFVTPWYGEFSGGAEVVVREAAENLAKKGIDVEVLTTCVRSPFDSWWKNSYKPSSYESNGVTIRRFPVNSGREAGYHEVNHKIINGEKITREEEIKFLTGSISSDGLVNYVFKNKDDYVFMLSPYMYGLTYWTYHSAPERCILLPCLHNEPQAYFSTTKEMMHCRKVLFKSYEEMELAKKIYGMDSHNFTVIGDGVRSHGSFCPGDFIAKYGIVGPYILSVGRKDRGKNIHTLVDYFNFYSYQENDGLKLVFVGGGDSDLVPKGENFIDLGFIDEEDKHNAYAGALATCQLSNNEAFSLVIMESWQASRPVIVSDGCPVTKGHCIRSNGGLFVADRYEFHAAVKYLQDHQDIADKMGASGRKYVIDNFTWDKVIQHYINAYQEFGGKYN